MRQPLKASDSENKMVLYALMAANAISRTPITEETIKDARKLIDSVAELRDSAIAERLLAEGAISGRECFEEPASINM